MKRRVRLANSIRERPPWALAPASALFIIALVLYQSLGKAVGAALVYSGAVMMIRFRGEPSGFLKALSPGFFGLGEDPQSPTAPDRRWQIVSLIGGLAILTFGVTCFVLSPGSW